MLRATGHRARGFWPRPWRGHIVDISMLGQVEISTIPSPACVWEYPHMSEGAENPLKTRIRDRIEATGKSMHAVSKAIGANPGYLRDLLDPEKKVRSVGADKLTALAQELDTTVEYLTGEAERAEPVRSQVSLADQHVEWRGHRARRARHSARRNRRLRRSRGLHRKRRGRLGRALELRRGLPRPDDRTALRRYAARATSTRSISTARAWFRGSSRARSESSILAGHRAPASTSWSS